MTQDSDVFPEPGEEEMVQHALTFRRHSRSPRPSLTGKGDDRDRPSRHGVLLGKALAFMAEIGRKRAPDLPETCATCAFRDGSMPNQMASTGLLALNCVLNVDPDDFACHHGMKDGEPTKLCAGYLASRVAPFRAVKGAIEALNNALAAQSGPDDVRAEFDAWWDEIDPQRTMDAYQLGRAWLRRSPIGAMCAERQPDSRETPSHV